MKPTLGVLITYYNEGELLKECVLSLLNAEDVPDEILVYDDASSIPAKSFLPEHPHIQLFRGDENRGPSYGRNKLLELSQSDYVHFHDADDLFVESWCQRIRQVITEDSPEMIVTGCSLQTEDFFRPLIYDLEPIKRGDPIRFFVRSSNTLMVTFLRRLAQDNGGYQTAGLEAALDYYFNARLALRTTRYTVIDDPLVIARPRPNSVSRDAPSKMALRHHQEKFKAINMLRECFPAIYHDQLAEVAAEVSSSAYRGGHLVESRQGFALAKTIGRPAYLYSGPIYQIVARYLGTDAAERTVALYRMIPATWRARIRASKRSLPFYRHNKTSN